MSFGAAAALFLCGIFLCMALGWSLALGLAFGLLCFALAGRRRGFSWGALLGMAGEGARTSLVVLRVLALIGCLTALWRASGTIALFVHTGLSWITPHAFLLAAFLLSAVLSMTFGSAFGVAGTAGVILAVMARTGGASLTMTAGAVLSGAYLGERLSPASSSAALAAAMAGTDQNTLQRRLWRTTPAPLALSLALYGILSVLFPIQRVDPAILTALEGSFRLSWHGVLPAAVLLALPFFRVKAVWAILASCAASALLAAALQGSAWPELARACLLGWQAEGELAGVLSGGGVLSMVNGMCIVLFSCASSGVLNETHMLDPLREKLERLTERTDLYCSTLSVALASAALLCNQSIALVLTGQMMEAGYRRRGLGGAELGQDLGNTAIPVPALIPWSIASSVPLAAMEAGPAAILFAFYLVLCPACGWLSRRRVEKITGQKRP